jgi:hypothetical protein
LLYFRLRFFVSVDHPVCVDKIGETPMLFDLAQRDVEATTEEHTPNIVIDAGG